MSGGHSSFGASEPLTTGKILLVTSVGDVDIELWTKEAPLTCRNFIQLCMEGYYDNCQFHRVVKDFMAQTGDPTNTGDGGASSFDGKEFADEFHSRLKFSRRGILGMASDGRDTNGSQFFITLNKCEFLNRKHTIFGKIEGETIYNILKFNDLEMGEDDRPIFPPHIIRTEILLNPFDDIFPRVQRVEKKLKKKRKKEKKNTKLLSFGVEADEDDEMATAAVSKIKKKSTVPADIVDDAGSAPPASKPPTSTSSSNDAVDDQEVEVDYEDDDDTAESQTAKSDINELDGAAFDTAMRDRLLEHRRKQLSQASGQDQRTKDQQRQDVKDEYLRTKQDLLDYKRKKQLGDGEASKKSREEKPDDSLMSPLEQMRAKYKRRNKKDRKRQRDTMDKLLSFQGTLTETATKLQQEPEAEEPKPTQESNGGDGEEANSSDDENWMARPLSFPKRPQDFDNMQRDMQRDDYVSFDPKKHPGQEAPRKHPSDEPRDQQQEPSHSSGSSSQRSSSKSHQSGDKRRRDHRGSGGDSSRYTSRHRGGVSGSDRHHSDRDRSGDSRRDYRSSRR